MARVRQRPAHLDGAPLRRGGHRRHHLALEGALQRRLPLGRQRAHQPLGGHPGATLHGRDPLDAAVGVDVVTERRAAAQCHCVSCRVDVEQRRSDRFGPSARRLQRVGGREDRQRAQCLRERRDGPRRGLRGGRLRRGVRERRQEGEGRRERRLGARLADRTAEAAGEVLDEPRGRLGVHQRCGRPDGQVGERVRVAAAQGESLLADERPDAAGRHPVRRPEVPREALLVSVRGPRGQGEGQRADRRKRRGVGRDGQRAAVAPAARSLRPLGQRVLVAVDTLDVQAQHARHRRQERLLGRPDVLPARRWAHAAGDRREPEQRRSRHASGDGLGRHGRDPIRPVGTGLHLPRRRGLAGRLTLRGVAGARVAPAGLQPARQRGVGPIGGGLPVPHRPIGRRRAQRRGHRREERLDVAAGAAPARRRFAASERELPALVEAERAGGATHLDGEPPQALAHAHLDAAGAQRPTAKAAPELRRDRRLARELLGEVQPLCEAQRSAGEAVAITGRRPEG